MTPRNLRIGLLALHWGAFNPVMPPQYRQEKEHLAQQAAAVLSQHGEVIYPGLITDEESGLAAGRVFESRADVVVVFPCMAAPPSFAWAALAGLGNTPLVIWNAHLLNAIPEGFDATDLVRHSSNVGSVMLTNVLVREGRAFRLVTGPWNDEHVKAEVLRVVRAGAAASQLRRTRLGVLGEVIPGYLNLVIDRKALKRDLGVEIVEISQEELTGSFQTVSVEDQRAALEEMRLWSVKDVAETDQTKSARLAVALDRLVEKYHLDGGTVNCRSPYFLSNPEIGIVACYAVSRLMQRGKPFTCTGDVPTAIAAVILKLLGAQAQWCECNVIDYQDDYMLLTDTGEGDPWIAQDFRCIEVIPNTRFNKSGCGACLRFQFRTGPATLLGFSPGLKEVSPWSLIIARGEIIGKHFPNLGVPNMGFRFGGATATKAFTSWCVNGATHHGVVTSGDYVKSLSDVADFLGINKCTI